MKLRICYAAGVASGLTMLMPMSALALSIGNFIATGPASGQVEISDLNQATYLDVVVELDSRPVNYVLEQISDYQVIIRITDRILDKRESLIEVSVSSDLDSRTRSFAYRNETARSGIVSESEARDAYAAAFSPVVKQLIVPSTTQIDDDGSAGEYKDGIFHINITKGQTSIGAAVEHLARAGNLNVLILPGDRAVHDSVLTGPVTDFDDLYSASNKMVRHVYIDRTRRIVRIVGEEKTIQSSAIDLNTGNTDPAKSTTIGQLLKDIAMVNDYTALIYPGDSEAILNTPVSRSGIKGIDDLALLIGKNGGWLDIDRVNRLLRARKK